MRKSRLKYQLAAILSALIISAMTVQASENDNVCAMIAAAVQASGSNVCVSLDEGVATLSGYVESATERVAAEQAAMNTEGVTKVINLITVSN